MIAKKSLTVLLLAVLGIQADAALRRRTASDQQDVRKLADGEKKRLLKDDAGFWSRFVQEVQSSLPVCVNDEACLNVLSAVKRALVSHAPHQSAQEKVLV